MTQLITNHFTNNFKNYICEGDSISYEDGPLTIIATIHYDNYTQITDYDCYSPDDIQRYKNSDWFFVGVVLSIQLDNIQIHPNASSVWGIEANFNDNNEYLTQVANDLLPEVLHMFYFSVLPKLKNISNQEYLKSQLLIQSTN